MDLKGTILEATISVAALAITVAAGFLTRWFASKSKTNVLVNGGGWLWDLCQSAVAQVWAGMSAEVRAAVADGKLTEEEKQLLKSKALLLVKQWLGDKGISEVQGVWRLASPHVEQFIAGYVERALGDFKSPAISNAPVLAAPAVAPA